MAVQPPSKAAASDAGTTILVERWIARCMIESSLVAGGSMRCATRVARGKSPKREGKERRMPAFAPPRPGLHEEDRPGKPYTFAGQRNAGSTMDAQRRASLPGP